jgi:hypothetical protein
MNYSQLVTAIQDYTENSFNYSANPAPINTFIEQAEQRIYNTIQFPSIRKNVTGTTTSGNKYLSCPDDFLAVYSIAVIDATGSYEYLLNKDVNFIRQAYPKATDTAIPKYYALFGPSVSGTTISNELAFILGPTPDSGYAVELHYYYYPESIVQGKLSTVGSITAGSGYVDGTYYNVPLTGGSGIGALATVVVFGSTVTAVTVTYGGSSYLVGSTISAANTSIGGTGSGFSAPITAVINAAGRTWLGDNFDSVLLYGSLVEAYTYMKGEQDIIALYDGKYKEALGLAKRLGDGMERQDAYRSGQYRQAVT